MKDFLKSEAFRRGVRTFVQAAAGYIVIHAMDVDFSAKDAVMGLLAASIAAGIAGIMNIDGDKNGGGEDNERN
jgi:hypothetical protein